MNKIHSLKMERISKSFPGVKANDAVELEINEGEVLGLLGENGAGKTTLMNILYGLYRPDEGRIIINGEEAVIHSPRDSMELGIGMIHQHFMLVQNHTVLENIALGYPDSSLFFPLSGIREKLNLFGKKYGFGIDPDKKIWELSAGQQQKVEILKALFLETDLLIMDEPTSVLTPQEIEELFAVIKKMTNEGHSVILISHKLDEILQICNRVTVLRKGKVVGNTKVQGIQKEDLARMMIGREVVFSLKKEPLSRGDEVLQITNLKVQDDRGLESVKSVTFTVCRKEVFGIAGVSGNGQRELVEAITGLRKASSGSIKLLDEEITNQSVKIINAKGITHVPEERIKFGIVPNLFIYENSVLKQHSLKPFSKIFFLDYDSIKRHAETIVDNYKVDTPSINIPMKNLSGGNIQKIIVGREMEAHPNLLVASHPTYGLDVGATEYIREQILRKRREGDAVLLVSEDLDELFEVCDRIAVMFQGEIMGILEEGDTNLKDIGLMMTGSLRLEARE